MSSDAQEKVRRLAYELYEKNGRREGRDLLDWLAAEQIIRFERMILPEAGGERIDLLEYKPRSAAGRQPASRIEPKARSGRASGGGRQAGGRGH